MSVYLFVLGPSFILGPRFVASVFARIFVQSFVRFGSFVIGNMKLVSFSLFLDALPP